MKEIKRYIFFLGAIASITTLILSIFFNYKFFNIAKNFCINIWNYLKDIKLVFILAIIVAGLLIIRILASIFFKDYFVNKIAIDIGSSNTLIHQGGRGIVLCEPTIIALDKKTGKIEASGKKAKKILERAPESIDVVKPVIHGCISDTIIAKRLIKIFLSKSFSLRALGLGQFIKTVFFKKRFVVSVSGGLSIAEIKNFMNVIPHKIYDNIFLIDKVRALALGAGLPIDETIGNMFLYVGGGTTEVTLFSSDGIVVRKSIFVGSDDMDIAIISYIKNKYNLRLFNTCNYLNINSL